MIPAEAMKRECLTTNSEHVTFQSNVLQGNRSRMRFRDLLYTRNLLPDLPMVGAKIYSWSVIQELILFKGYSVEDCKEQTCSCA